MRIASVVLAVTLAACSGGGGGTTAAAQIAQYGPILQQCMELRTLDLLSILDDFAAILSGPPGPFEREIDVDGDGDSDLTVSGGILDTGPGAREIDWTVAGAIAGSGVLSVTVEQDGTFLVAGDGMLADSECDFEFEIEEATLLPPPPLAGATPPCPGQRVGQYRQTASSVHRSSGSRMTGRGVWSTGPRCVNNPQVTVPMGSGPWPPFCIGGCGGTATIPPTVLLCAGDVVGLLNAIIEQAGNLVATAVVTGSLPPNIVPVAGPPDTDFTFQFQIPSPNVTVRGALFFPRDPTQPNGIQVGDEIGASMAVSGDVIGSLVGMNVTIQSPQQIRIACESGALSLQDCEIDFSFLVTLLLGTTPDLTGTAIVDRLEVFSPHALISAALDFLPGMSILVRDVFLGGSGGVPVQGTFTIPSDL